MPLIDETLFPHHRACHWNQCSWQPSEKMSQNIWSWIGILAWLVAANQKIFSLYYPHFFSLVCLGSDAQHLHPAALLEIQVFCTLQDKTLMYWTGLVVCFCCLFVFWSLFFCEYKFKKPEFTWEKINLTIPHDKRALENVFQSPGISAVGLIGWKQNTWLFSLRYLVKIILQSNQHLWWEIVIR